MSGTIAGALVRVSGPLVRVKGARGLVIVPAVRLSDRLVQVAGPRGECAACAVLSTASASTVREPLDRVVVPLVQVGGHRGRVGGAARTVGDPDGKVGGSVMAVGGALVLHPGPHRVPNAMNRAERRAPTALPHA